MKITWYGHSCFKLESGCGSVVIDPYADGKVEGLRPLKLEADECLCSHGHDDHAYVAAVRLTGRSAGFEIEAMTGFHDDKRGSLRGRNAMHIISDGEVRVAHLGDIGGMPDSSNMERLKTADLVFVPVGGFYTISPDEADRLVRELEARIVVPMHYRTEKFGYPVLSHLDDFLALRDNVVRYEGNSFELRKDTPSQTAVLTYI